MIEAREVSPVPLQDITFPERRSMIDTKHLNLPSLISEAMRPPEVEDTPLLRTARREAVVLLAQRDTLSPNLQTIIDKLPREMLTLTTFWPVYCEVKDDLADAFSIPLPDPNTHEGQEEYAHHPLRNNLIAASLQRAAVIAESADTMKQLAEDYVEVSKNQYNDPVTGLGNQKFYKEKLPAILAAYKGRVAYFRFDVDNFKKINDATSHEEADEQILAQIGDILRLNLRSDDLALAMRPGGDEFVLAIPGIDEARATEVAQEILAGINKLRVSPRPGEHEGTPFASASMGITIGEGKTQKELDHEAEIAAYKVKKAGKNNFMLYTEDMAGTIIEDLPREE